LVDEIIVYHGAGYFLDCLTLENGKDELYRNFGNRLSIYTTKNPRRALILYVLAVCTVKIIVKKAVGFLTAMNEIIFARVS